MLGVHWSRHAQAACPRSRPQSSRLRHQTTTRQPESCRDIKSVSRRQPHVATPLPPNQTNQVVTSKMGSRLQFPTCQVVTSIPCRDLLSSLTTTNQVATSLLVRDLLETNLCRDIDFMSRPRSCPQWDFQVATSHIATHVATSKMMSRPPIQPAINPRSSNLRPTATQTRSRRHFLVATSRPTKPNCDLITMSRPQEVLTHNELFFSHPVASLPATPLMQ